MKKAIFRRWKKSLKENDEKESKEENEDDEY